MSATLASLALTIARCAAIQAGIAARRAP